ncbi:MAG: nucleotidyltransferase domain-containing protein [Deltaproteobacteria bacterium]|jgi:predicted nucleotidyltransferase
MKMPFGLSPQQYEFILKIVVHPLEALGASVWCYGSRARGDHSPFSDLDLMVESDKDLSREISSISDFLEESQFPYKVEIVLYSHFAEQYKAGYENDKKRFLTP